MTTVFIISAPSGSGKSTLVGRLLHDIGDLMFSVSYTTRPPRGTEREGDHYHYICKKEFEERLKRDEFLEHACGLRRPRAALTIDNGFLIGIEP